MEIQCPSLVTVSGQQTVMSQSGLEALYGGYKLDSMLARVQAELQRNQIPPGMNANEAGKWLDVMKSREKSGIAVRPAPLMFGVVLCVLVAALIGFSTAPGLSRAVGVGGSILVALVLLAVQARLGFPLEQALAESLGQNAVTPAGANMNEDPFGGVQRQMDRQTAMLASMLITTRYTPWFYLWLLLIVGAFLVLVIETVCASRGGFG